MSATCGTSSNNVAITAVGVKRIESLTPDAKGVFAPSPLFVLKGNAIQFRAIPDPTNAAWPPGMPTWQIEGSTLTNSEPSWSFQNQSTSTNDTKLVVAKCGTSSGTNNVTVFAITLTTAPAEIANDYTLLTLALRTNRSLANLYAEVTPPILGLPLTAKIASAVPDTTDKGQFAFSSGFPGNVAVVNMVSLTGIRYDCWYLAKLESSRNREDDELKPQTVTFDVLLNQQPMGTAMVMVNGHFKWLKSRERFQDAVDFANLKYGVGVNSPVFDPLESDFGATDNATVPMTVSIGRSSIDRGENWTAAALLHEMTHVNQGRLKLMDRNIGDTRWEEWKALSFVSTWLTVPVLGPLRAAFILLDAAYETEAWSAMLGVAELYGLTQDDRDNINGMINDYDGHVDAVNNAISP